MSYFVLPFHVAIAISCYTLDQFLYLSPVTRVNLGWTMSTTWVLKDKQKRQTLC